jgi:hypothetical protein
MAAAVSQKLAWRLEGQCLERQEAYREASIHASQSRATETGAGAGRMALEQFSLLRFWRTLTGIGE